jgi:hypothetical protein
MRRQGAAGRTYLQLLRRATWGRARGSVHTAAGAASAIDTATHRNRAARFVAIEAYHEPDAG